MTDKHEQQARELLAKEYGCDTSELSSDEVHAASTIIAALELRASNQNAIKLPKINGVSRDEQCPNCVIVWLGHDATDDQVRAIHDKLRAAENEAVQGDDEEFPDISEGRIRQIIADRLAQPKPAVSEDDLTLCEKAAEHIDMYVSEKKMMGPAWAAAIRRLVQSVRDNNK